MVMKVKNSEIFENFTDGKIDHIWFDICAKSARPEGRFYFCYHFVNLIYMHGFYFEGDDRRVNRSLFTLPPNYITHSHQTKIDTPSCLCQYHGR